MFLEIKISEFDTAAITIKVSFKNSLEIREAYGIKTALIIPYCRF